MAGKGSKARPIKVERKVFESNWDNIFGRKNEKIEEERPREFVRLEYSTSYRPTEWDFSDLQKGGVRYAEYSVQYHPPSENN